MWVLTRYQTLNQPNANSHMSTSSTFSHRRRISMTMKVIQGICRIKKNLIFGTHPPTSPKSRRGMLQSEPGLLPSVCAPSWGWFGSFATRPALIRCYETSFQYCWIHLIMHGFTCSCTAGGYLWWRNVAIKTWMKKKIGDGRSERGECIQSRCPPARQSIWVKTVGESHFSNCASE